MQNSNPATNIMDLVLPAYLLKTVSLSLTSVHTKNEDRKHCPVEDRILAYHNSHTELPRAEVKKIIFPAHPVIGAACRWYQSICNK